MESELFFKMFLFCILELKFDCVIIISLIYQICTYLQNIPNCIHLDTSHLYGSNFVHLCSVRKSCCSFPHTIHSHKLREKDLVKYINLWTQHFILFFVIVVLYKVGGGNHLSPNLLKLQNFPWKPWLHPVKHDPSFWLR